MYLLDWGPTVGDYSTAAPYLQLCNVLTRLGAYSRGTTVPHHQIRSDWGPTDRGLLCRTTMFGARKVLIRLGLTVGGLRCRTNRFGVRDILTQLGASSWGSTHERCTHSTGGRQCYSFDWGVPPDLLTPLGAYR